MPVWIRRYLWVFIISMVPIVELRGAVPIGVGMGLPLLPTYIIAVLGNMLPVPVILLLAKPILIWCTKLPGILGRFFQWIYEKGVRAGEKLMAKAGNGMFWALFLFVAIPLPGTGAWTGCLAATLLDLKFWPSVLAVLCGVMTAGLIMGAASAGLFGALGMLFAAG
ncbi:MAG: small multi-drug export protein [Subdoligranulum sp.]|nr:small multi-drug export protein [Subdoligranulum sp.]MBD5101154.1 small multi-drug export protein [Subdoligranulum sp.]